MNSVNTALSLPDGPVSAQECPVCCRLVLASLLGTHMTICMDRSGDCDIGVVIPMNNNNSSSRPQTAVPAGATAVTATRSSSAAVDGGRPTGGSGPLSVDGDGTRVSLGSNGSGRIGGVTSPIDAEGFGHAAISRTTSHSGGGGDYQLIRPSTATHQPNNSQYYRHYNDNYYTPANELHRSQSTVTSTAIDRQHSNGGGAGEDQLASTHNGVVAAGGGYSSSAPSDAMSSRNTTPQMRFEVGLVIDTSTTAMMSSPPPASLHSPPSSAVKAPPSNCNPREASNSPPHSISSASNFNPTPVSSEKVAQLMSLFPNDLDLPSTAGFSSAGQTTTGGGLSSRATSFYNNHSNTNTTSSPSTTAVSTQQQLATKEALIREALAAANNDANIAAMILLEAGSGWAAPPQDAGYSAADTIETPRGSLGGGSGGNWGSSNDLTELISGGGNSGGNGGNPRVVYASRPPSRSNSNPRLLGGGHSPAVIVSSRHNTVTTDIDDEMTAAVIGAPTGAGGSNGPAMMHHQHHHAAMLMMKRPSTVNGPSGLVVSARGAPSSSSNNSARNARSSSRPGTASQRGGGGAAATGATHVPRVSSKVELIIYDLKPDMSVAKKLGLGAYHSGVVVYGSEIAYGGSTNLARDTGKSGVWAAKPGRAAAKVHERIMVGETHWTAAEIRGFIKEWGAKEFIVDNYHLLSCNCNHFSQRFLAKLGEKGKLTPNSHYFVEKFGANGYNTAVTTAQAKYNKKHSKQQQQQTPIVTSPTAASATGASSSDLASNASTTTTASATTLPLFFPALEGCDPQIVEEVCSDAAAVKAAFAVPAYVNRAASVGQKMVPDFIFKAFMQKVTATPNSNSKTGTNTAGGLPTSADVEGGASSSKKNTNHRRRDRSPTSSFVEPSAVTGANYATPVRGTAGDQKLMEGKGSGRFNELSPYPLPTPNTERGGYSAVQQQQSAASHHMSSAALNSKTISRREYDSACFISAALGLVISPAAVAMESEIAGSPSKEDLVMTIPPSVYGEDAVFMQCLRALRAHNGDTSAALEQLVTQSL